ncbi:penicillin-binding transpeptidase domain-containing protein [Clostridiisalibacter paucivorans]|uniref:penicillin-binding transpeptidase domain-containing protein n=1 Tax=Clostridiisalibacter paucivorans TaxID=408753 RepID=UPI000685C333|nr:penicillin-binding transpeptidase domain-containing protein [Clostridiisalibacter paucivorans]
MKLREKLKDRYNILLIILSVIFAIMGIRLAILTAIEGPEYREISDNKRVKEVPMTAPRGEIRDRYGRLLAGNKPSFTVQIMKDEIKGDDRNKIALKLVNILEKQGEIYIDELPIKLNNIEYKNFEDYLKNIAVEDEIIDIIMENNLLNELLDTYYVSGNYESITAKKASSILHHEDIHQPFKINIDKQSNKVSIKFDETEDIEKWKKKNNIPRELGAKDTLIHLLSRDEKYIRGLMGHDVTRELIYKKLVQKGLGEKYILEKFDYNFDKEYKEIKISLMERFDNITMETTAKEDFINIVLTSYINQILNTIYESSDSEGEYIIPGKMIMDKFDEANINVPVEILVDKENNTTRFKYKDIQSQKQFYKEENINNELDPLEAVIYLGKKTKIIDDIITDSDLKYIIQKMILNDGTNPKISIAKWEYVALLNKKSWLGKYGLDEDLNAEDAFYNLCDKFGIDDSLSFYEKRHILNVIEQLGKQGYRAYQPVNISYGVNDITVAKIMENSDELRGVKVSVEPVRYYPMGKIASHVLGYLGKISQPNEIEKYIEELGYSPNDIIGKTGVEEEFEEYLKGEIGSKKVEVDVFGNTINVLDEKKAIPGDNLFLTIDTKLQKVAEDSLKYALEQIQIGGRYKSKWGNYKYGTAKGGRHYSNATSGSLVAIDVKTGEILALANYPSYDPNLFSTGISLEDWESLKPEKDNDPLAPRPLYNIALQTAIQPGSAFKMITALAGLQKGISPYKKINSLGYVDLGNQRFGCWIWNTYRGSHGPTDMFRAIKDSCNYYFYTLAAGTNMRTNKSIGVKVDIEDILYMAKEFGLNDKTGIEISIPNEAGKTPDPYDKTRSIKRYLTRFLNNNIRKYIKEDVTLTDKEIKKVINEIASWTELEEPLSRAEVMRRLYKMNIDGRKKLEGDRANITDIIKFTYLQQAGWKLGDTFNISIGQGQNTYTPLQIANFIATLSNGGYRYRVSVVDKLEDFKGNRKEHRKAEEPHRVGLDDYKYLDYVMKGMNMAATDGTGKTIFRNFPIQVGIKTGTAEKDGINPATGKPYDDYAWFVAFAPYEDPQIAIATVIFQGGHGGYAGPVVRDVIAEYLGLNTEEDVFTFNNKLVP